MINLCPFEKHLRRITINFNSEDTRRHMRTNIFPALRFGLTNRHMAQLSEYPLALFHLDEQFRARGFVEIENGALVVLRDPKTSGYDGGDRRKED
jgi:hypothetical protein